MNYLDIDIVKDTFDHINFNKLKKCNAITCIHNSNGHCTTFKDLKCDFFENTLCQEQ